MPGSDSAGAAFARHAAPWAAFLLVHAVLVWLCLSAPGRPLGDVDWVYRGWAEAAVSGTAVVGITTGFVYPILALVPILAAMTFGDAGYLFTWLGLVSILNAVAFAVLLGRGRNRRQLRAAWWWLAFLALLGPIALARIDAVTVPLVIIALLWLRSRPTLAVLLLAVATWVKVWPAAILAALLVVSSHRRRVILVAVAASAAIVLVALLLGSGSRVFSFVGEQAHRGIQIESPISLVWMWQAAFGAPGSAVYYDRDILTYQVTGAGTAVVSELITPLLAVVASAVVVLGMIARRRGTAWTRLFPALSLALVLTLILVNKVGSPQFLTWLAAPVILGLVLRGAAWRTPMLLVLALAALTQIIYPYLYDWLLAANPVMVLVLTVRTVLELALLGWAVREFWPYAGGSPGTPVAAAART